MSTFEPVRAQDAELERMESKQREAEAIYWARIAAWLSDYDMHVRAFGG